MHLDINRTSRFIEWLRDKINYDFKANTCPSRIIRHVSRGQVYKCNFGVGIGSEYDKVRPCVIIQNDGGNRNSPNTIVAPITSDPCPPAISVLIVNPYQYQDEFGNTVQLHGYVNLGNITTISKIRLKEFLCDLSTEVDEIDEKIMTSLGIYKKYSEIKRKLIARDLYILKLKEEKQDLIKRITDLMK